MTALHYTTKSGGTRVVKSLLERGADAYVRDGNGVLLSALPEFVEHVEVVVVLREHYEKEREPLWSVFFGNVLEVIGIGGKWLVGFGSGFAL